MERKFTIIKPLGTYTYTVGPVPGTKLEYESWVTVEIDSPMFGKRSASRAFSSSPSVMFKCFEKYESGLRIQDAFSRLSPDGREWLLTAGA